MFTFYVKAIVVLPSLLDVLLLPKSIFTAKSVLQLRWSIKLHVWARALKYSTCLYFFAVIVCVCAVCILRDKIIFSYTLPRVAWTSSKASNENIYFFFLSSFSLVFLVRWFLVLFWFSLLAIFELFFFLSRFTFHFVSNLNQINCCRIPLWRILVTAAPHRWPFYFCRFVHFASNFQFFWNKNFADESKSNWNYFNHVNFIPWEMFDGVHLLCLMNWISIRLSIAKEAEMERRWRRRIHSFRFDLIRCLQNWSIG